MVRLYLFVIVFFFFLSTPLFAQQAGSVDRTFGEARTGLVIIEEENLLLLPLRVSLVQPDGKILFSAEIFAERRGALLCRLNADGSRDATFGTAGIVDLTSTHAVSGAIALQPDGKILMDGPSLTRFNTDGTIDTSFGSEGRLWHSDIGFYPGVVGVQADGKILVLGMGSPPMTDIILARLQSNGDVDSFGSQGRTTVCTGCRPFDSFLQSDGKIIVGASQGDGPTGMFFRFNSDGTRDTSFGEDGMRSIVVVSHLNESRLLPRPGGKILLAPTGFYIYQFNSDGSFDSAFGEGGTVELFPDYSGFRVTRVLSMEDGNFLAYGYDENTLGAVLMFNSSGRVDATAGLGEGSRAHPLEVMPDFAPKDILQQGEDRFITIGHRYVGYGATRRSQVGIARHVLRGPPDCTPTDLLATPSRCTEAQLTWSPPTDSRCEIAEYRISRGGAPIGTRAPSQRNFTDSSLTEASDYLYTITAATSDGTLYESEGISLTTPLCPNCSPTDLLATPSNCTEARLNWSAPADNRCEIAEYRVSRGGEPIGTRTPLDRNFADSSLTEATEYRYTVTATTEDGVLYESPEVSLTTPSCPPPNPCSPGPFWYTSQYSCRTFSFRWRAPDPDQCHFAEYKILRDGAEIGRMPNTSLSFQDGNVAPSTRYEYTVETVDAAGTTLGNNHLTFTTRECPPADIDCPPQDLVAVPVEPLSTRCPLVRISWHLPEGEACRMSTWQIHVNGTYLWGGIVNDPAYFFVPLPENETHTVRVSGFNVDIPIGQRMAETTVFVPSCPVFPEPEANPTACSPTNLEASHLNSWRARLTWNDPLAPGCPHHFYGIYRNGVLIHSFSGTSSVERMFIDAFAPIGSNLGYTVLSLDQNLSSQGSAEIATTLSPHPPNPEWNVQAFYFKTNDFTGDYYDERDNLIDTNYFDELLFTGSRSFNEYIREVSYGQSRLVGETQGPLVLPGGAADYCSHITGNGVGSGCNENVLFNDIQTVLENRVDLFSADLRIYFIMGIWIARGDGGDILLGLQDGSALSPPSTQLWPVLVHEAGHAMINLWHNGYWACTGGPVGPNIDYPAFGNCRAAQYGPTFGPMGASTNYHFHASNKERFGYLAPSQTETAATTGTTEYTLDLLELPTNGIKKLEIPLPVEGGHSYLLEYRKPVGFDGDRGGRSPLEEGIYIRVGRGRRQGIDTQSLTPTTHSIIQPGSPFVDPYRRVRIDVLEMSIGEGNNQARVRISWE